jgi:hypothetical protein
VTNADNLREARDAVERIVNRGGDADDLLREVTTALHDRAGYAWAAIRFVESDDLMLGPSAGEEPETTHSLPVEYRGREIARLEVAPSLTGRDEEAFLQRVATLVSPYCLVGWDTHGEGWEP